MVITFKQTNVNNIFFPDRFAKLDDWDQVFQKYLLTMSIETNADLKRSYAKHLQLFVSGLREGVVRWLSKGNLLINCDI